MNESQQKRFSSEHQFMLTCPTGRLPAKSGSLPGSRPNFHPVFESEPSPGLYLACRPGSSRQGYNRSITTSQLFGDSRNDFKSSTFGYPYQKRCQQHVHDTVLTFSFEHMERSLNFDSFNTLKALADTSWRANPSFPSQESRWYPLNIDQNRHPWYLLGVLPSPLVWWIQSGLTIIR